MQLSSFDDMAQNKPNATPRSKPPAAAAQDATSALIDCGLADLDRYTVVIEYTRADAAYLQGNHAEALRLMNDLVSKCENKPHSAWAHHLCGGLCFKVASDTDDPDAKLRHTKDAVSQAKKAAGLCPRKLDYALFYAEMLRGLGNYEEAVEECERALSIENPECPEPIVEDIRSVFRLLIQESNIAIISRWMNGEESRGRRAVVDPIELRLPEVLDKKPESLREGIQSTIADMEEQSMPEASQPKNMAEEQQEESKEQEVTEASQQENMAEEQPAEIKEQEVTEASQQEDVAEKQHEEIKEQEVTEASQQEDVAEEQQEEIKEQEVTEASQQEDMAEEQQEEIKEQEVTEASQQEDKAEEQQEEIKEQEVTEASQQEDKAEEQQKEIKEQVVPEASQPRKKAKKSKKIKEQSMPQASQQENPVKSQSKSGKGTKAASPDVPDWVQSYWDSLSSEGKKDLLTIKVSDLKKHLSSFKDCTLSEVLEEAISLEECFHNSWEFWSCGECNKKFVTSDLLIHHAREEHWARGWPKIEKNTVPESVDDEWLDYLDCASCEPVDLNAATKMLEEMQKSGDDISLYEWPESKDPERRELLIKIYVLFEALGEYGCLSSDIVRRVTKFAVDELKGFACGSAAEQEVNQTPVCIRFLGAPELNRIKKFLEEASQPLKFKGFNYQKYLDNSGSSVQGIEIVEKIRLGEDGSLLVIDEQSLPCKIDDVSCAPNASHVVFDSGVILDSDALLSWIFSEALWTLSDLFASWKLAMLLSTRHQKAFQILTEELENLLIFYNQKSDLLRNEEALMVVEDLCLEEGKKKDRQDYKMFLEERCKEQSICATQKNVMMKVLSMAKLIKNGGISFEEAYYGGITSHPKDCWRKKAHLHEADSYVEAAIQKQRDDFTTELSKADVELMRVADAIERVQDMMASKSSYNFRAILLTFIKSFLKAQVEGVAMIEATKKSDALAEELISADLAQKSQPEKKKGKKKKKV